VSAPVKVGDVVRLNEPDYMYGAGRLVLRVTKVGRIQTLPDGAWLDLEGIELRPDGTQVGIAPRHALARVTALPSAQTRGAKSS
jgi:predicted NAD/FAD-binding protein